MMEPNRIPGNEPDAGDMAEASDPANPGTSTDHDLPDTEAETLGDFA
jgi:hypothetical protein